MTRLSRQNRQILELLSQGMSDGEINRKLGLNSSQLELSLQQISLWVEKYDLSAETRLLYERALRGHAESALRSLRARFNALLDSVLAAVLVVDGRTGLIRQANQQAETMFGYQEGRLIGVSVEDLVPDQHKAIHPAYRIGFLTSVRKREMGYHPPIFAKRADGKVIEVAIALTASIADDDVMVVCTEYATWETSQAARAFESVK